jgi:AcrR family transcriptional regulator
MRNIETPAVRQNHPNNCAQEKAECHCQESLLVTNIDGMTRWHRTHAALRQAAMELFAEHGYEATSTAAIAERAGVSEMTLFRHFKAKETLLLDDPFDPVIAEAVRLRPVDEAPMCAIIEGIRQVLTQVELGNTRLLRERLRIVTQTPSLLGAIERNSDKTVTALVSALVERGVPVDRARVAASAVIAGLGAALLMWAQSDNTALVPVLVDALDVLRGH